MNKKICIELKCKSLEEIRKIYKNYLTNKFQSKNAISTSSSDALYLFRKMGNSFWDLLESEDFNEKANKLLLDYLTKSSKGDILSNKAGYSYQLKNFRKFAYSFKGNNKWILSVNILRPSIREVDKYLANWKNDKHYYEQEKALDNLFFKKMPLNDNISDVLIKASVLNDFYSTNIFSIYDVAKKIVSLKIDKGLTDGDLSLPEKIMKVKIKNKEHNFYSFATKYCSHHNPEAYAIYDSYVDTILCYFREKDNFSKFKNNELKEYKKFHAILIDFKCFYGLGKYSLKETDKYLWQLGKEYFLKSYNKDNEK